MPVCTHKHCKTVLYMPGIKEGIDRFTVWSTADTPADSTGSIKAAELPQLFDVKGLYCQSCPDSLQNVKNLSTFVFFSQLSARADVS